MHGHAEVPVTIENWAILYRERPDGSHTTVYGLGQSIAAAPLYLVGSALAGFADGTAADVTLRTTVLLTNAVLGALIAVFLALLCRGPGRQRQRCTPPGRGLYTVGTFAWPMMKTFYAEPGTALCVTAGLWLTFATHTDAISAFAMAGWS